MEVYKLFLDEDHPIHEHTFKGNNKLSNRKQTSEIILHCAATPEGKDYTVDTIDRWHRQRNFTMIGYHYVIYRDGSIHRGRPENASGGHCTNHNYKSIGVCYIGGCAKDGKTAKDTRTEAQKESFYLLVYHLLNKYNLTLDNVYCHNQFAKKACPSFKIDKFKDEYRDFYLNFNTEQPE